MTEAEFISAIRSGDRRAFDGFCRERYASLISYARLFVPDEWAEDVVQDVLFGVWERRGRLRDDGTLSGYLLRSVYNCCLNYLKRRSTAKSYYEERIAGIMSDYYAPETNPVLVGLFRQDLRNTLENAVSTLSPRVQEVFRMSYVEDMSNKEIAERLGLSVSTVENHMYAALKQLRAILAGV